ncbi:FAD-dependent oxidoreductase [Nocardia abscessus]|uniref:FAD-dependent oxidoreductase n=1 Tax=Nocardia abscessus TaxID=120957 RepID=UPI003CC80589
MAEEKQVDVVVIGGGAAGLSAALTLARARRTVVVVDAREPRNAPAAGVHGWLTRDGIPPAALVTIGAREVEQYGGRIRYARAMAARRTPDGFVVDTDRGGRGGRRPAGAGRPELHANPQQAARAATKPWLRRCACSCVSDSLSSRAELYLRCGSCTWPKTSGSRS